MTHDGPQYSYFGGTCPPPAYWHPHQYPQQQHGIFPEQGPPPPPWHNGFYPPHYNNGVAGAGRGYEQRPFQNGDWKMQQYAQAPGPPHVNRSQSQYHHPERFGVANFDIPGNVGSSRAPIAPRFARPSPTVDTDMSANGQDDGDGGVLMYIDNSNIWINTMETSVKQLGFRSDIKYDLRTRVDIIKLLKLAGMGRPIIRAVLYGSEPPPVSKFWNNIKEIKFCPVDVQVTRRSTYNNREREVDQNIMLDIGVDLVIHQNHAKHGGTIILFTGDGGMVAAVRRALEYNWNVELWTYRNSLAKHYQEVADSNDKFQIKFLDDHFNEFVFYKLEWKIKIPRERSCVLTFRKIPDSLKPEVLETFVKAFTQLVRMPMAGLYFKDTEEGERSGQTHLVIVCSVGKLILKEDSRSDFHYKTSKTETPTHSSNKKSSTFHFPMDQWERIPRILNLEFLLEDPGDFNARVKVEVEGLIQEILKNSDPYIDNPKYDFNSEVYHRIEETLAAPRPPKPKRPLTLSPSSEIIIIPVKEQMENYIQRYKPTLRSLPQFLQDLKLDEHDDIEPTVEARGIDDDGQGQYTVHTGKRPYKKKFQKYSQECKYSYRCSLGFKCNFNHSDKEKEFFKIQPNSKLRQTYKFKSCDHFTNENSKCKYSKGTSYMCPFAHGFFCLTCKCDDDGGHNKLTCQAPLRPQSAPEIN